MDVFRGGGGAKGDIPPQWPQRTVTTLGNIAQLSYTYQWERFLLDVTRVIYNCKKGHQ